MPPSPAVKMAKAQNAAARKASGNAKQGAASDAANAMLKELSLAVVQFLMQVIIPSFGLSLIPLLIYTMVKDFAKFPWLADPGDVFGKKIKTAQSMAGGGSSASGAVSNFTNMFARLFIYPAGFLYTMLLLTIVGLLFSGGG